MIFVESESIFYVCTKNRWLNDEEDEFGYLNQMEDYPGIVENDCILVSEGRDMVNSRIIGRLPPA